MTRALRRGGNWLWLLLMAACDPGAFSRTPLRRNVIASDAGPAADGGGLVLQPQPEPQPTAGAGSAGQPSAPPRAGQTGGRPDPDLRTPEEDAGTAPEKLPAMDANPPACSTPCAAPHASGTCESSGCHYACSAGYADCDADLMRGAQGNGCEVALALDAQHCGRCDLACSAPAAGYASCDAASCVQYALEYSAPMPTTSHGTPNAKQLTQLCPEGSVVSGFDGFVDDELVADSVRLHCSPLTLSQNAAGPQVSVGEPTPLPDLIGGTEWERFFMVHTPYAMQCPAGEIVAEVVIALWSHWGMDGVAYPTVKDLGLRCARPRVDKSQLLHGTLGPALSTGVNRETEQVSVALDGCGDAGLIRGFRLSYGINVDELITLCSAAHVSASAP